MLHNKAPISASASEFGRIFYYDRDVMKAFKDWFYDKSMTKPEDLKVTWANVEFTIKVIFTAIQYGSHMDIIKVTSDALSDTPAMFTARTRSDTRAFEAWNHAAIIAIEELPTTGSGIVQFKDAVGSYLYLDLNALTPEPETV